MRADPPWLRLAPREEPDPAQKRFAAVTELPQTEGTLPRIVSTASERRQADDGDTGPRLGVLLAVAVALAGVVLWLGQLAEQAGLR